MKFSQIAERLKSPKDEKGGGLLTLLGISSIVLVAALSVAGAATFGTILTHKNLAGKQALNSSDSGISEALFKLSSGMCEESGFDSTLKFSYKVYHSEELTAPSSVDATGLSLGCPTNLDRWVLIEAEGEGKNNTKKNSVATFKWLNDDARVIPQFITGEQVSLTSVEIPGSAAGLKIRPSIYSKNGGVVCSDPSEKFQKNVNINAEAPTSFVDCPITGDIRATADIDLNTAEVQGDVCSTGLLSNASNVFGETLENSASCKASGSMYGYSPSFSSNTIGVTAESCANIAKFKQIVETVYAEPTILNATSCGTEFSNMLSATDEKIFNIGANDLTVVVDEDTIIRHLTVTTSEGPSSLNFVIPSSEPNSTQSSCAIPASFNFENVIYNEGANGLFYSPCSVNLKGSDISGQVYGGQNVVMENTSIHYYPVELINAGLMVGDGNFQKQLVRVS